MNPKDVVGATKVDLSLLPPAGLIHGAHALMDGAVKYGPYNWREHKIQCMTYLSAAMRHIQSFQDREDIDPKSGCHHIGHAIAGLAILLDALETGNLIDNRPPEGAAATILNRIGAEIAKRPAT
jgi:hypothetical protein